MIHSLKYEIVFPNGRKLKNDLKFLPGVTAIVGRNGQGKSTVLEMIRYALFGTGALRSTSADYDSIEVDMSITIRGEIYRVVRTLKKATFYRRNEVIATGTGPVNEKVIKTLGFGLTVFDVACAANQHDLLRMTDMSATDRRRMIDSVIGLSALDAVTKWLGEEIKATNKAADLIRSTIRDLVEPPPSGIPFSLEEGEAKLRELGRKFEEFTRLAGKIDQKRAAPNGPPREPVALPSDVLKSFADDYREKRLRLEQLTVRHRVLPAEVPKVDFDRERENIRNYNEWLQAQDRLRRNVKPNHEMHELLEMKEQWVRYRNFLKVRQANAGIKSELELLKERTLTCPECSHEWSVDQARIDQLLSSLQVEVEEERPAGSDHEIEEEIKRWSRFDASAYAADVVVQQAPVPRFSEHELTGLEAKRKLVAEREALDQEIKSLRASMPAVNFEEQLATRLNYERELEWYRTAKADYDAWALERAEAIQRQSVLEGELKGFVELRGQVQGLKNHQMQMQVYEKEKQANDDRKAHVARLDADITNYGKARDALVALRLKIKEFLLPGLNKVASGLVSKMSGGEITRIVLDEEFELLVDGRRAATLSGSEKVCANLALRIALGQVLVSGVLSVFLGDELDGSMDAERAENNAATLGNLVNSISQIILVSHKDLDVDHTIIIGDLPNARLPVGVG